MASNNLHRTIFHGDPAAVQFPCTADQNRLLSSPPQYASQNPRWNLDHQSQNDRSDDDDDDVVDVDDDIDDDDLDDADGYSIKNGSAQSSSQKGNGMNKDGGLREKHEGVVNYENVITVVEPESYRGHGRDGSGSVEKENGNGTGGRLEVGFSVDPWEMLRMQLVDPVTGVLMDDAMILPCGHSFGHGGMQLVVRMKACRKCSHPISEDSVRPNLALRAAVQAFQREEASQSSNSSKRKKDRFEQEKCSYENPYPMDLQTKRVQFPFAVSDRVIIKGNKRTPQRFVGRVGVVTTQCLNGWYVVKTLDNAESVKLQYRSLAKFTENSPSSMIQSKSVAPNWL